jgi:hypothetical protein
MDNNLHESAAIETAVVDAQTKATLALNELQLAYVGGGIAELVGV